MTKLKSKAVAGLVAISLISVPAVVVPNRAEAVVAIVSANPVLIVAGAIFLGAVGVSAGIMSQSSPAAGFLAYSLLVLPIIILPADAAHGYQPTLEFTPIPLEQRIRAGISRQEYLVYMEERALLNSVIQQVQAELPAASEVNRQNLRNAAQRIEELRLDAGVSDQTMLVARKVIHQATRQAR